MAIEYRIFSGDDSDGPVDYTTPVATVSGLTWTGPALAPGTTTRFAVRARDTVSGLEEMNTDAVVSIAVDATGADLAGIPASPAGLLVTPIVGGDLRAEWDWPHVRGPYPVGFRLYHDSGTGTVNYSVVRATVAWGGILATNRATLTGLVDATTYKVAVRAYNATGEEANIATATAIADATPPGNVENLSATPTSRA